MASPNSGNSGRMGAIERSMGFWWRRGLSRTHGRLLHVPIKNLLKELDSIIPLYAHSVRANDMSESDEVKAAAGRVFSSVGPQLWPNLEQGRPAWLATAAKDTLDGLYPRDLCYSRAEDRERLRASFCDLVVEKCLIYQRNHPVQPRPQAAALEEQQYLTGSESGTQLLSESSEHLDDNASADYCPTGVATRRSPSQEKPIPANEAAGGARVHAGDVIDLVSEPGSTASPVIHTSSPDCRIQDTEASPVAVGSGANGSTKRSRSRTDKRAGKRARRDSSVGITEPRASTLIVTLKLTPKSSTLFARHRRAADRPQSVAASSTASLPEFQPRMIRGNDAPNGPRHEQNAVPPRTISSLGDGLLPAVADGLRVLGSAGQANNTSDLAHSVRYNAMVTATLAEYVNAPVAQQLLSVGHIDYFSKHELERIRSTLDKNPAARTNMSAFVSAMNRTGAVQSAPLYQADGQATKGADHKALGRSTADDMQAEQFADTADTAAGGRSQRLSVAATLPGEASPSDAHCSTATHFTAQQRADTLNASDAQAAEAADAFVSDSRTVSETSPADSPLKEVSVSPMGLSNHTHDQPHQNDHGSGQSQRGNPTTADADARPNVLEEITSRLGAGYDRSTAEPRDQGTFSNMNMPFDAAESQPTPVPAQRVFDSPSSSAAVQECLDRELQTTPQPMTSSVCTALSVSPRETVPICEAATLLRASEDNAIDVLERTDVEVDWACDNEFPSFLQLESCYTADDFFAKVDEQVPPDLRKRSIKGARVQHVNAEGKGRNVSCRIVRHGGAGVATFRTLVRRLRQLDGEVCPELRVTVEWDDHESVWE